MTIRRKSRALAGRWFVSASLVWALLLVFPCFNCGGGGGDGGAPPATPPTFTGSGTASGPNLVTLTGSSVSSDQIQVNVRLGGPTTSDDLYSFAFDLLLSDPNLLQVRSVTAGDALSGAAAGKSAQATMQGSRVVVGVTKLGASSGNGVSGSSATVVSIAFRTLRKGSTTVKFAGAYPSTSATDAAALDHAGVQIATVAFDSAAATITQP